jgi:predicted membrane-bound dolichyl-phosphate-mannose-protein mannosyltransferase
MTKLSGTQHNILGKEVILPRYEIRFKDGKRITTNDIFKTLGITFFQMQYINGNNRIAMYVTPQYGVITVRIV